MDPNWRGQLPPPPTFSFPGTAQMHPAHPYPVGPVSPQRFPPECSCPSPMDLASSAPYTDSSGQQAFQGHFLQNPAFQGQGQPFVGQGAGVTGLSGAMDQCHHIQPVVEMSGLQDLSGDVLVDCPGPEDCDNVENAAMGQSMQHVASPVYMGPVTFTPVTSIALGSHLLPPPPLPSSTVPNSMMFVPQVSAPGPGPVQYMLGPQQFVLQQEAVGVGIIPSHQKGLLGPSPPPPLVMEQTPVMAAPQMNVSMVGPLPPNHSSGQQPPMFAGPPRLGPGGRAQQGMEFVGGKRQGDFVLVRQVPQQGVRMEASATVGPGNRPHQRAGGLDSSAGFPVQSGSGTVVAPLQQGQGVSFQPGWNKEQTRYHQANLGDARFGSQYPHGFPGSQRGPASQPVGSGGLVWPGQVSGAQHETWQQQGRRSVRSDSKGVASVGEEVSSLSLNQATNSSPMPMEMEAKPVLPVQAPSLLDVRFSTAGGGEDVRVLREVVQRFAAETYGELWHQTFCVPQKAAVSQQHPDKALVRTREGEFRVCLALEQLSIHNKEHMFVLGDYQYENFLNHLTLTKVHPEDRPFVVEMLGQLRMEQQFGDFDLLVLHPQCGLMVFGLCSVNSNSDVQYILKRVQKARAQLEKSVMVAQRFVATLGLACPVTHVFCTPNLKRSFLSRVVMRDKHMDKAMQGSHVLCSNQLPAQFRQQWFSTRAFGVLLDWWAEVKDRQKVAEGQLLRPDDLTLLLGSLLCPSLSKVDFDQSSPPAPSESRPLILENAAAEPNPSMDTVPGVEPTKWPQKEFDVSGLYLSIGSVTKPFASYMEEYVDLYYPHYLTDTYRVPPIHFNIQKITREGAYDLLELPMSKDKRGDEGENRVVGAVEILGLRYPAARPAFIICDFQYNNYLNKLKENMFIKGDDRRPRRAYGQSVRAQHDCLLIHRRYGIIIISVKAVGDNFKEWASTGSDKWQAVKRTLRKVLKQLPREQTMVNMVLSDLTPTSDLPCIKLVALPNLSRSDIDTAVSDDEELKEDIKALFPTHGTRAFLCKDELCEAEESIWETYERCPEFFTNLCRWWDRSVGPGRDDVLSEELYKQIIGRFCGLLSTVEVWSAQSPRVEVRNLEEAVQETAERYARIVLTREQLEILHQPTRRVFLSGPPGTGKTMLLVLRAQRWVEEEGGGRAMVVVLNLRHGSAGLSLGHLLQKQVTEMIHASPTHPHHAAHPHDSKDGGGGGGGHSPKHQHHHTPPSSSQSSPPVPPVVKRVDYNSCMFDEEQPGKLGDIPEGAYIVVDEVDRLIHPVLKWVLENRKPSALWCAGQFQESCPEGFEPHRLDRILRCPPMVQRVLEPTSHYLGSVGKETRARSTPSPSAQPDLSEQEKHHYVFSSTPQGLSTDGARPLLIFHSEHHNSPSRLPAQCSTCGSELGDHLLATLHLQTSTVDQAKRRRLGPLPTTTGGGGSSGGVSMRDVVIVCNDASPCPLVTALKKRGLTVSIVTDTANPMVAMPTHDTVVFTTPQAMKGLERKVVVYIPSEAGDQLGKTTTMTSTLTATTMKGGEEREEGESGGGGGGVDDLKVRQALEKLTADDKVMLWYTASRCLSQLVIIVP